MVISLVHHIHGSQSIAIFCDLNQAPINFFSSSLYSSLTFTINSDTFIIHHQLYFLSCSVVAHQLVCFSLISFFRLRAGLEFSKSWKLSGSVSNCSPVNPLYIILLPYDSYLTLCHSLWVFSHLIINSLCHLQINLIHENFSRVFIILQPYKIYQVTSTTGCVSTISNCRW